MSTFTQLVMGPGRDPRKDVPPAPAGCAWSKGRRLESGGRVWILKHPVKRR